MDQKQRIRVQLECLYDMFRDRIDENVVYIVYTENEGKIDTTIDQLMSIAKCSFTGYDFEPQKQTQFLEQNNGGHRNSAPASTGGHLQHKTLATAATNTIYTGTRSHSRVKQLQQQQQQCRQQDISNGPSTRANGKQREGASDASHLELQQQQTEENDEGLSLDEKIERLQESIENLLQEKQTCHEKASTYLTRKMFPVTSYYSELASQYRRMIETKTRRLVDLLLLKSQNANTIDLHGLNPIQARLVVSELLNIRLDKLSIDKQGEASIDIITGWGKHSVTEGHHRIRPTIVAYLREKGYDFYRLNKGALRVTIRR